MEGGDQVDRISPEDSVVIKLSEIMQLSTRINIQTKMACWVDVAGHVSIVKVKVASDKENFETVIYNADFGYNLEMHVYDWNTDEEKKVTREKNLKNFHILTDRLIKNLNDILSYKWATKYTAYCNLIEMGCHQVFVDELSARDWVAKMKRKYGKVGGIVDYRSEILKVD
jgi:hypothetical protein